MTCLSIGKYALIFGFVTHRAQCAGLTGLGGLGSYASEFALEFVRDIEIFGLCLDSAPVSLPKGVKTYKKLAFEPRVTLVS